MSEHKHEKKPAKLNKWKQKTGSKDKDNALVIIPSIITVGKTTKVTIPGLEMNGNAINFRLTITDPLVSHYLTKLAKTLSSTQADYDYTFEFHPMHTTGHPVYIRMVDNDDTSSMTKFDTKNRPNAPTWGGNGGFMNQAKITLGTTQRDTMVLLITQNYAFLQALAHEVYEEDGLV